MLTPKKRKPCDAVYDRERVVGAKENSAEIAKDLGVVCENYAW